MSNNMSNESNTDLNPELIELIEQKRKLAIEKRNKRQAIAVNHMNMTSNSSTSNVTPMPSSSFWSPPKTTQTLTNIKPKTISYMSPNKTEPKSGQNGAKGVSTEQLSASISLISSKRFAVNIAYNSEVINVFRKIESKDWNPNTKQWSFDIKDYKTMITGLQSITSIDLKFVDSIPNRIITALIEAKNESKVDIDLSERLSPKLMDRLYSFQSEGIQFAIRKGGRCLIADDMGLGKTMQAIGIAQWFRDDWPLLIVCPSTLRFQWFNNVIEWLPDIKEKDVLVVKQVNENLPQIPITIISYDLMGRMRTQFSLECKQIYNFIILDESHYIKSDSAVRTEAVHLLAKSCNRIILLTGTPALSRPMELFTQIKLINPKLFSSKHEFGERYCDAQLRTFWQKSKFGKANNKKIWDYKGAKHLDELKIVLEATLLVRRLKTEVLQQLTKKKREMVILNVNHITDKQMSKLSYFAKNVKNLSFKKSDENTTLFEWYVDSALAKIVPVSNYLEQLLNQNIKLLCFCHHKQMMDGIQEILAKRLVDHIRIDGNTPNKNREEACNEFQTRPECRVALLSITACATGLNLTAASTVVFAEIFWNPGILSQAEDRVHRIGQLKDVKIIYLVAKNTIDDMIWPMISKKLEILNKAGLSKDNFEKASTTMNALEAEQHLITEFFDSLNEDERKSLIEDDFHE